MYICNTETERNAMPTVRFTAIERTTAKATQFNFGWVPNSQILSTDHEAGTVEVSEWFAKQEPYLPYVQPPKKYVDANLTTGCAITWEETVFGGSPRKPVVLGTRTVSGTIVKESYGAAKQQHTFTIEVSACTGYEPIEAGAKVMRKGRNLYGNLTAIELPADHAERAAEKAVRGEAARAARSRRRANNQF